MLNDNVVQKGETECWLALFRTVTVGTARRSSVISHRLPRHKSSCLWVHIPGNKDPRTIYIWRAIAARVADLVTRFSKTGTTLHTWDWVNLRFFGTEVGRLPLLVTFLLSVVFLRLDVRDAPAKELVSDSAAGGIVGADLESGILACCFL